MRIKLLPKADKTQKARAEKDLPSTPPKSKQTKIRGRGRDRTPCQPIQHSDVPSCGLRSTTTTTKQSSLSPSRNRNTCAAITGRYTMAALSTSTRDITRVDIHRSAQFPSRDLTTEAQTGTLQFTKQTQPRHKLLILTRKSTFFRGSYCPLREVSLYLLGSPTCSGKMFSSLLPYGPNSNANIAFKPFSSSILLARCPSVAPLPI